MNKLLCEILNKCYDISRKTVADVFFDYSPHVNSFTVYVYRNGWKHENAGDMEYFACSIGVTKGNLISTMAKLLDLEYELEVA